MLLHPSASRILAQGLLIAFLNSGSNGLTAQEKSQPAALRIGLSSSLFHDVPEAEVKQATKDLQAMIEAQTSFKNTVTPGRPVDGLVQDLSQGKLDLGVFVGHEFAWGRLKEPKLQPLMVAVAGDQPLRVHVLVRADNTATGLVQLQGKPFALPRGARPPTRLYLERQCRALGKAPQAFFARITNPDTHEDAFDDVVDGVVQGVVADTSAVEAYKRRKPGRFAKLREVTKSDVFPASVIAYYPGRLEARTLQQFREDLLRSNNDLETRRLLMIWKLTRFDPVPDDYDRTVANVAKAYPPDKEAAR